MLPWLRKGTGDAHGISGTCTVSPGGYLAEGPQSDRHGGSFAQGMPALSEGVSVPPPGHPALWLLCCIKWGIMGLK